MLLYLPSLVLRLVTPSYSTLELEGLSSQTFNMAESYRDPEKHVEVESRAVHTSDGSSTTLEYDQAAWETGVLPRFPWLGIGSLFCVLLSAGAAALVLVLCNGRAQSHWPKKVTPSVILAGINAFANIMLAIAIGQGVAIAWWRKMLGGATVKDLHHSWGFSTSLAAMVKGWRYLNVIALAALAAKLAIVDSILLQRSLQTYLANDPTMNSSIITPHVADFPMTGIVAGNNRTVSSVKMDFQNSVVNGWSASSPGSGITFQGCDGTCVGGFEGVGFSYALLQSSYPPEQINLTESKWHNGSVPIFDLSFEMSWANATKKYSSIFVDMLYFSADSPTGDCTGALSKARYEVRPAVLDMDITLRDFSKVNSASTEGATVELGNLLKYPSIETGNHLSPSAWTASWNDAGNQFQPYHVKRTIDYTEDGSNGDTKLGGIFLSLQMYMASSASIAFNPTTKEWDLSQVGSYQLEQRAAAYQGDLTPGSCNYNFFSGTENQVLYAINRLGFAITTDTNNPTYSTRNVTMETTAFGIHYRTNFGFMAGAIASMVVCVLLVLPTYWKFWELGRPVSLAPVEIANAFRAPVLDSSKASNAMVEDLLKEVGNRKVMFGEGPEGRLAVEEIGKVKRVGTA